MATLIRNAQLVNEGRIFTADVLLKNGRIEKIDSSIGKVRYAHEEINADGLHLLPGLIDDQVHFREPGLTHKATIYSEARAAVAGGVTSFMEMPNTKPPALTQQLLEDKYSIAARNSLGNYSFYMGASNDNLKELHKTDKNRVCGIKVFIGSSTGNMLVDNEKTLERIFGECDRLIAVHSESEQIIRRNLEHYKQIYGDKIPMKMHPEIRSAEACYVSTEKTIALARKLDTRLHILHISTEEELSLFENRIPLKDKRITTEVCVHHLWFDASDYDRLGGLIKCNPAIKEKRHKEALFKALLDDRLDIIATDHAPHTWQEKQNPYLDCPSGLPLVQHSLLMMLEFYQQGRISLTDIVNKMSHAPAVCFRVKERGYLREGYWADLVLVNLNEPFEIKKENIFYRCGWSPLEGQRFGSSVKKTLVNGNLIYDSGRFNEEFRGQRLEFES